MAMENLQLFDLQGGKSKLTETAGGKNYLTI